MSAIEKLYAEINKIEEEAGQLDPTDYEALYKLLASAYFKSKDINEYYYGGNEQVQTPPDDSEVVALKEQVRVLEAYKDGAELSEVEHKKVILELSAKLNQVLKVVS